MTGRINKIEGIFFAFVQIIHLDGVALDGNTALPFQIHVIKKLGLHLTVSNRFGKLQQAVGQRTFAVVNMSNNAEIANVFHSKISIK